MDLLAQNPPALYLLIGLIAIWRLPIWGQKVLKFLRDFRRYRKGE